MAKSRRAQAPSSRKRLREQKRSSDFLQDDFLPTLQSVNRKQLPPVEALTEAQGQMISQILSKDIVFVTGPAGTGKTFVSAALAAQELEAKRIDKIVITRPMQGVDEEMGFLPGTEAEKYAPWCEPVMDVLNARLGKSYVEYLVKTERIQCKPLMLMRGKSFENSWILMDEAQNVTPGQMKMFLTRIGHNCKMIVDGDEKQCDLKDGRGIKQISGLTDAKQKLKGIPEVGFVEFSRDDIVRHGIIRKILDRYEG